MNPKQTLSLSLLLASLILSNNSSAMEIVEEFAAINITKKHPKKTKANHLKESEDRPAQRFKDDPGITFQEQDQENIEGAAPYIDFDDHLPEGSPDLVKVTFINNTVAIDFKAQKSDETFEFSTNRISPFITKIIHIRIIPGSFLNSMTIILTLEDDTKKIHKFHYEDIDISPFMAKIPQPKRNADFDIFNYKNEAEFLHKRSKKSSRA